MVNPTRIVGKEFDGSILPQRVPANGPIISIGYAGKIHIGVISAIVNVCVDQLIEDQ